MIVDCYNEKWNNNSFVLNLYDFDNIETVFVYNLII